MILAEFRDFKNLCKQTPYWIVSYCVVTITVAIFSQPFSIENT